LRADASGAAEELDTVEKAREAGYEVDRFCVPGMGVHWINPGLMDTELDPSQPEALLFEPQTENITDPDEQRFLGIEYIAVTEGTEHNSTETVPTILGVPLHGPMAGHSPDMPWHADLHVYQTPDAAEGEAFPDTLDSVQCPQGTTPPRPE